MDAVKLKESLSRNDILSLLEELGGEPYERNGQIISRTICHNPEHEGSHKLYYVPDKKYFHCFTSLDCGTMDIFQLISQIKGTDFVQSLNYIKDYFGIEKGAHIDLEEKIDMSFFNKFNKVVDFPPLPCYDESILNRYDKKYHMSWVKDYISPDTMERFGVRMDMFREQIIIPHYDLDNRLVGVRVRNLNTEAVESGMKYVPLYVSREENYRHMTGSNLFGANISKESINKLQRLILFEGEKSVMALDTMYNGNGIGVGVSGANLTDYQVHIIDQMNVEEVIIAFDKEFKEIGDPLERFYAQKIEETIANRLKAKYKVSVIWDTMNLLDYKDSPTDKGADVWQKLWDNRIRLN